MARPPQSLSPVSDTPALDPDMHHSHPDPASAPPASQAAGPLVQPTSPAVEASGPTLEGPAPLAVSAETSTGDALVSEHIPTPSVGGMPWPTAEVSSAATADSAPAAAATVAPPAAPLISPSLADAPANAEVAALQPPVAATVAERAEPTANTGDTAASAHTTDTVPGASQPSSSSSSPVDTPAPLSEDAEDTRRAGHNALLASLAHAAERSRSMFGTDRPPPVFFPLSAASVHQNGPDLVIEFHPGRLDPNLVQYSSPPSTAPSSSVESASVPAADPEPPAPASVGETAVREPAHASVPTPAPAQVQAAVASSPGLAEETSTTTTTQPLRPSPVPSMSAQIRRIADVRLARVQGIHIGAPEDVRLAASVRSLFEHAAYMPVHPIFIPANASTLPFACLYDPLTELAWPLLPFSYDQSTPAEEIREQREHLLDEEQRAYAPAPAPLLVRFQTDHVVPFFPAGQTGSRLEHARAARAQHHSSLTGSSTGQDSRPLPGEEQPAGHVLQHLISGHPFRASILFLHTPEELATLLSAGGNGGAPEQPDPVQARAFVDGLERVDAELRTRMGRLGMGDIGDVSGESAEATTLGCGVCLEPYEAEDRPGWLAESEQAAHDAQVVGIPCPGHHVVHAGCLREWLACTRPSEWSCPFCRAHLDSAHTHTALSSSAKAAAGTAGRSVREEVRFRERAHGWRCDAPACLPRYPDENNPVTNAAVPAAATGGSSLVPDDYTVLGRLLTLTPCHHQVHLDCMLTSLRVADEQRYEEDEDEDEDEDEGDVEQDAGDVDGGGDGTESMHGEDARPRRAEPAAASVPVPVPVPVPRAAHVPEQGQTNVAHLYNLLSGQRRPLRMSSWPFGLHYGGSPHSGPAPANGATSSQQGRGSLPWTLDQAHFSLSEAQAQAQPRLVSGSNPDIRTATDRDELGAEQQGRELEDADPRPLAAGGAAAEAAAEASAEASAEPDLAAPSPMFARTRSGQLKVRGRWVGCPTCRREVWAEIPLLRRPREEKQKKQVQVQVQMHRSGSGSGSGCDSGEGASTDTGASTSGADGSASARGEKRARCAASPLASHAAGHGPCLSRRRTDCVEPAEPSSGLEQW